MAKDDLLDYANKVINEVYSNKNIRVNEAKIIETKSDSVMISTDGMITIINAQSLKTKPEEVAESIAFASNQFKELYQKERNSWQIRYY